MLGACGPTRSPGQVTDGSPSVGPTWPVGWCGDSSALPCCVRGLAAALTGGRAAVSLTRRLTQHESGPARSLAGPSTSPSCGRFRGWSARVVFTRRAHRQPISFQPRGGSCERRSHSVGRQVDPSEVDAEPPAIRDDCCLRSRFVCHDLWRNRGCRRRRGRAARLDDERRRHRPRHHLRQHRAGSFGPTFHRHSGIAYINPEHAVPRARDLRIRNGSWWEDQTHPSRSQGR
jgi:hypothetical protein